MVLICLELLVLRYLSNKMHITVSDYATLPTYDFYKWSHPASSSILSVSNNDNVEDCSPYETRVSSLYNIRQFNDKSRAFKKQVLNKLSVEDSFKLQVQFLENTFWELFNDPDSVLETEIAMKVTTKIHESGFENKPSTESNEFLTHPWNLHNLPICDNSMLRYLPSQADSILLPSMTFGMFYSTQSWSMEDHWLYHADFMHMGDCKVWYFVAPEDQSKFEAFLDVYLNRKLQLDDEKIGCEASFDTFNSMLGNQDVFSVTLENRVLTEPSFDRALPKNEKFAQFMVDGSKNSKVKKEKVENVGALGEKKRIKHFNDEVFISPKVLQDNGIKVFATYQQPNEYIIKFPKAYSSSVSLGTTVNEGVNFATKSWLPLSQDASNWLNRQSILPNFSTWKFLINLARHCDDVSVIGILEPLLSRMVGDELDLRTQIRSVNGIKESNNSSSSVDSVTDSDLADCFPSYIKLTDLQDKKSCFTMLN
ncbi:unnamed protein product [Ambrosiozyma monospora]|uniref:Unnamed protein product n=1 Tax=Ambrosiozyma monospora TaxID=43982 RepID=A0A9W6Z426_AMBMO|nr:unnamed protein product [Ambrosiozyma monospora]